MSRVDRRPRGSIVRSRMPGRANPHEEALRTGVGACMARGLSPDVELATSRPHKACWSLRRTPLWASVLGASDSEAAYSDLSFAFIDRVTPSADSGVG